PPDEPAAVGCVAGKCGPGGGPVPLPRPPAAPLLALFWPPGVAPRPARQSMADPRDSLRPNRPSDTFGATCAPSRPAGPGESGGLSWSNWLENDSRMPQGRLAIVSYAIVGMIVLLLLGFWKLQVIDSERFTQLAERNRIRAIPIMAPRGRMLDREGRVLVDNYASFSILLLRDAPQQVERNVALIAEGLNVPLEDLEEQLEAARELPKFQPIVIKPEATQADIAFIESHRADFPALEMLMVHRRRYPPDGFLAHASGYVGEVSASEVQ